MSATLRPVSRDEVRRLISSGNRDPMGITDQAAMDNCLLLTTELWVGMVNGELVCVWGLIPPTLMSDQAHLWLYTTDAVEDHTFLFVRNSQRAIEAMLEQWPTIVGYTDPRNDRAIRWIKWLGGEYSQLNDRLIRFVIRKK